MLLAPKTYADFMTRLTEVDELLNKGVPPYATMAADHFAALADDLDELLGGGSIHVVENADFVERFTEVWLRFK